MHRQYAQETPPCVAHAAPPKKYVTCSDSCGQASAIGGGVSGVNDGEGGMGKREACASGTKRATVMATGAGASTVEQRRMGYSVRLAGRLAQPVRPHLNCTWYATYPDLGLAFTSMTGMAAPLPDALAPKGLEGVVANESSICYVFGGEGRLIYRGYDIADLAEHSTFEETAYLLLKGDLPTKDALNAFTAEIKAAQKLDRVVLRIINDAPKDAKPMNVLRTAVSAAVVPDPARADHPPAPEDRQALQLIAQLPTIVGTFHRLRSEQKPLSPRRGLSLAANCLYLLTGENPDPEVERAFDVALILHADHELNASTFAARVIAATLADMHGAVAGAIAALAGPL